MSTNTPRHARIIATVGPASNDKETLKKLVEAGVDIFRLNFSHGTHEDHSAVYANIRMIEDEVQKPITIMQDLQGPKIRIGEMDEAVTLKKGATFILDTIEKPGNQQRVQLPHPEILSTVRVGDLIYINDGIVRLRVCERSPGRITTDVIAGGTISSHKGVNLPGVELPVAALTEKDKEDLMFGLQLGVDIVALSFVQRAKDVTDLRKIVGEKALILSKIEKPSAVECIDEIIAASDAIMVARGDLGVEMPLEEVPSIQKRLIRKCREAGKPVVVATQMLESMVTNASPTRAEVSDVANATFEGADALMLSAETAAGKYPVESVEMMSRIIKRVEQSSAWRPLIEARGLPSDGNVSDAITSAVANFSENMDVAAIVTFTESGSTARRMARQRPSQPILVLTPYRHVARRLKLIWGTTPYLSEKPVDAEDLVSKASAAMVATHLGKSGDRIIITAGIPIGVKGSTNLIRVETIA